MRIAPGLTCVSCHNIIDHATEATTTESLPEPGCIALCWFCGNVAVYIAGPDGLELRALTSEETEHVLALPEMAQLLRMRAEANRQDVESLAHGDG
jgi:hypothetical protein